MMKNALIKPNLPSSNVLLCAVGEHYTSTIRALEKKGIDVVSLHADDRLPQPVRAHADMLMCHVGKLDVVCSHVQNVDMLHQQGFRSQIGEAVYQAAYPGDIHLNQLIIGDLCMGLIHAADPAVLRACQDHSLCYVDINQGYAKCSVAVVSQSAIITDDYTMAKAALKVGIDVLIIRKGHISLPGYDYGFIGGTCGLIAPDHMAFAGRIEDHPDFCDIAAYLKKYNVAYESLTGEPLLDIGGIIPLCDA